MLDLELTCHRRATYTSEPNLLYIDCSCVFLKRRNSVTELGKRTIQTAHGAIALKLYVIYYK